VHRVYGKHCSWDFYTSSLVQTCFIVIVTYLLFSETPQTSLFFNPIIIYLNIFYTTLFYYYQFLLFFVLTFNILFLQFKHIHDTTHWHNNHTTNKEGTKAGNDGGNDGGNNSGRPGTVSGIVSVSVPVNCELYFNVLKEMAPNYFQFISNDKNGK